MGRPIGSINREKPFADALRMALPLHYFSGGTLQGKTAPSGFAVRVTAAGSRSFVWFHRVNGKGHLETIGSWGRNEGGGDFSVYEAIKAATDRAKEVAKGVDGKGREVDPRPERTRRKHLANSRTARR